MANSRKKLSKIIVLVVFLFFIFVQPVLAMEPNDTDYYKQWYLQKIGMNKAWEYGQGQNNVVLAIIDTGVWVSHPDLAGNIWVNMDEIGGDGIDNDNNGYIDDTNGWNFIDSNNNPSPDLSQGFFTDGVIHGTAVAGIAAAVGNNFEGIAGVNWAVRIMPVRALDNYGSGDMATVTDALYYAVNNGAQIINMSFVGSEAEPNFKHALQYAYDKGVLVIAAAGNIEPILAEETNLNKIPLYPACFIGNEGRDLVLSVAAVDKNDKKADFSNYGSCVDISAPGEGLYSTQIYEPDFISFESKYVNGLSGTSIATPLVSGVAALIKSLRPQLTNKQISDLIVNNADPINNENPSYVGLLGRGRLNGFKAVQAAMELFGVQSVRSGGASKEPKVEIYDANNKLIRSFLAYAKNFRGGVNVAVGDVNGDGYDEIITGAGAGGGPHVRIMDQKGKLIYQWFPFSSRLRGGVNVAVGDINGDQKAEIITSTAGDAQVKIFNYRGQLLTSFYPYGKTAKNGITVSTKGIDGLVRIITETKGDLQKAFDGKGKFYRDLIGNDRMVIDQKYAQIKLVK